MNKDALYTTYPTLIKHDYLAEQRKVSLTFRLNIRQVNILRPEEIAKSSELFMFYWEGIKKKPWAFCRNLRAFYENLRAFCWKQGMIIMKQLVPALRPRCI